MISILPQKKRNQSKHTHTHTYADPHTHNAYAIAIWRPCSINSKRKLNIMAFDKPDAKIIYVPIDFLPILCSI